MLDFACTLLADGSSDRALAPILERLLDEAAIRQASGKPNGRLPLELPPPARLESLSNPEEVVFSALRPASELSSRRLRAFSPEARRQPVGELIASIETSFERWRALPSFLRLEAQVQQTFQA